VFQTAYDHKLAFVGLVHQLDPTRQPQLTCNGLCNYYADGFVAAGLVDEFCRSAKPEASISGHNAIKLVQLMRKIGPSNFNNYQKQETKSNF
jgi:hypothetical protein